MSLSSHWKLATLSIAVLAGCVFATYSCSSRHNIADQVLEVFDTAFVSKSSDRFVSPVLRIRDGTETFCIQEAQTAEIKASEIVSDISEAFKLRWKRFLVEDLSDCPVDETVFFVLQGKRPNQTELLDFIERIVGSRPSDPRSIFPEWARGLSVSLPGPGNREFVFASSFEGVPHHAARAILLEELLQSILRASDVPSNEITSLLGEDLSDGEYKRWFDKNPMGFCSTDIILLELLVGPSTSDLVEMNEMRVYLSSNFDELLNAAERSGQTLAKYADSRCWIWELP